MKNKRKKLLLIIIPSILLIALIVFFALSAKGINADTYFNAINNSSFTKHIQTTKMTESNIIVYQKTETIIYASGGTYHKIDETTLSTGASQYETTTTEYYYSTTQMYYNQNGEWKTVDFNLRQQLIKYNLKVEYFESVEFTKNIEITGELHGVLNNQNVKDVFGESSQMQSVNIEIVIRKNLKAQEFNINAIQGIRDVEITNLYSYDKESVTLPI